MGSEHYTPCSLLRQNTKKKRFGRSARGRRIFMRYKISYFGIYEDHLLLPVFLFRMIRVFMIYSWGLTLRFFCPRKVQGFYRQEILWVFYLFILCVGEGGEGVG